MLIKRKPSGFAFGIFEFFAKIFITEIFDLDGSFYIY